MGNLACAVAALSLLVCLPAMAGEAKAPLIRADGSLLNEGFDGGAMPEGWSFTPGGNRRDASFKDGMCILNPGKGDNNILAPRMAFNLDEPFVIEIGFGVPAPTKSQFCVLSMAREGGEFQVVIVEAGDARKVMMGNKTLGVIQPGKTYTLGLKCNPDGTYEGLLTGPGIDKPEAQSVSGVDGAIRSVILGNVFNAGEGGIYYDYVKAGKPAK